MTDASKTGFDTSNHHGDVFIGLSACLCIYDYRPVRAFSGNARRCIGIIGPDLAIGCIVVDHGIHVA